jgi:hypothetical protein
MVHYRQSRSDRSRRRSEARGATDQDPQAERQAERSKGTFEELHTQYLEQYAKKKNKSWHQADKLVRRNLLPRWGKLKASSITRSDVKAAIAHIESESVQNQSLAASILPSNGTHPVPVRSRIKLIWKARGSRRSF